MARIYISFEWKEDCFWRVLDARTYVQLREEARKMNHGCVRTPLKNGSAVLGHCIYVIGGTCEGHTVKIYDTKKKIWKLGTAMDATRHHPLVVPVPSYNMLFVFGGTTKEEQNWAECYYIDKDKWEAVQSPDKPKNPNLTGHFVLGETLVLWNQELFYTFNMESKTWKYRLELEHHLPTIRGDIFVGGIVPSAVRLDDSLFWFNGAELLCYDLTGRDNTLDSLHPPKDAKILYRNCFKPLASCFLVLSSEEKKFHLIGCDKESGLRKSIQIFSFQFHRVYKHGPFFLESCEHVETVGAPICHCLTVQQSSNANGNDTKSGLQGDIKCEEDLLKDLSRGMYIKNYLSLTRYKDCEADCAPKTVSGSGRKVSAKPVAGSGRKVEISIRSLMEGLGLEGIYETILDRIIDKQVLNQLSEDDIKALNIPVSHKPVRCSEEQEEGDSDTEENPRDLLYRECFALSSSMPGYMLPNLRKIRDEPGLGTATQDTVTTARSWSQKFKLHRDKAIPHAIPPWKILSSGEEDSIPPRKILSSREGDSCSVSV